MLKQQNSANCLNKPIFSNSEWEKGVSQQDLLSITFYFLLWSREGVTPFLENLAIFFLLPLAFTITLVNHFYVDVYIEFISIGFLTKCKTNKQGYAISSGRSQIRPIFGFYLDILLIIRPQSQGKQNFQNILIYTNIFTFIDIAQLSF